MAYCQDNDKLKASVDAVAICYIVLQMPRALVAIEPQGKQGAAFQVIMAGRQAGCGPGHGARANELNVAFWSKLTRLQHSAKRLEKKSTQAVTIG